MLRRSVMFLAILFYFSCVSCLERIELYPFGTVQGDNRLPVGDDVSSSDIQLITPISFYDDIFTSLYINLNGLISFETELPAYRSNLIIPFGYKIIAPFFADVDISLSGNVYYRETQDPSLLNKAAQEIHKAFPSEQHFRPESVFIVTWDDVGAYQRQFQPTNTFQMIIASDEHDSFAAFLYPADGINWVQGQGKSAPIQADVPAQVGFDSGEDDFYYTLPGSGIPEVSRLTASSNVNVPGVWMFQIGRTNGQNIITPELSSSGTAVSDSGSNTCADRGHKVCHASARCTDHHTGFCCSCNQPYIGNGQECIRPDEAQRISGKVTGYVNGQHIDGVDLHAYVVTTDGRTYTAISKIPQDIGYPMQGIYSVGSILGFLFALPQQPAAKNGFMITGGQFNRTASIEFQSSRDTITLKQTFSGQDAQGHMRMSTKIDGSVPNISPGSKFEVDDYKEEYRRTSPGVLKSHSTQTFRVDGTPHRVVIDQTINYQECAAQPLTNVEGVRLSVTRNFVVYSESDQIVRYSQTNKVSATGGFEPPVDVCRTARCDPNADCVPGASDQGQPYRCVCKAGFEGDGQTCRKESCLVLHNCHHSATCQYDWARRNHYCKCNEGFRGDGYRCEQDAVVAPDDCSVRRDLCDVNAQCSYESEERRYVCRCNEGYEGDGQRCARRDPAAVDCSRDPRVCDRNARCQVRGSEYACVCNPGYSGDGYRSCSASSVTDRSNYLLYAQGMYIMETSVDSRSDDSGKQTLYIPGQTAIGIDVDCLKKYFYWTDVSGKTVSRAKLDGTDSQVIVRNLGSPEGVAVDWLSENVYWTDSSLDKIEVSRFDGTQQKTLFSSDLVNPRAITVDPMRGIMFWTDWNRDAPKIEKSNMDGTDRSTLISDGLGLPNGLTIDFEANNVCWADAGTRKVECTNYDGRNRRVIVQSAGYPFGLSFVRDAFYWTDWEKSTLPNANKNSNRPNEDITLSGGANGKLYGITTVKSSCPAGSNQCMYNNGGCRFLCLPTSRGGRTCACPNTMSAEECRRSSSS